MKEFFSLPRSHHSLLRFETAESQSKTSEELREELLVKLMDRMLLGPTHQVLDMKPSELPYRELPPGNVSSLYLMYLAYMRPSGQVPACKSTFYTAWKSWAACLCCRHASEHTMCLQCQTLKAAIRASADSSLRIFLFSCHIFTLLSRLCLGFSMGFHKNFQNRPPRECAN